jgi:diaminopimelate epimerase
MINQFFKYQSLGNDFILFDWTCQKRTVFQSINHPAWEANVVKLCDRHFGIGADGVLVLRKDNKDTTEMLIFNSNGSQAEICLNGIRCCAYHQYLNSHCRRVHILAGTQLTRSQIISRQSIPQIMTHLSSVIYEQAITIATKKRNFIGHQLDVGNPHCVILEKTTPSWLSTHGSTIEQHELFPRKTNVEFVWHERNDTRLVYRVLVYERGCGMTLACSSGAAAVTKTLHHLGKIRHDEKVQLLMQGGVLECMISADGRVSLTGTVHRVFSGNVPMFTT